jgi:hypothetical protein
MDAYVEDYGIAADLVASEPEPSIAVWNGPQLESGESVRVREIPSEETGS